jgi:acetolactate synthase small subunit
VGDGKYRRVILRKKYPFSSQLSLSSTMQRKFRDDNSLKFMMADVNDYEYFIELLGMREKYDHFVQLIKKEGEQQFVSNYQQNMIDVCSFFTR